MKAALISWIVSASLLPILPSGARAQEGPISLLPTPGREAWIATDAVRTTTNSAEYCSELQDRVDTMARDAKSQTTEQVLSLSQEGGRLCKHGQTRSGIQHLRRAFILIRPPEGGH
ncbi:MAG: hypothetical protein EXR01_05750 [Acetobacteraceae bacterium]|nr:hypothetical protein [Acetobacteraceae bacterium]